MTSNPRYSALEHGGLEVPEIPNAPEVVPGSKPPLDRRSSLNQPETLHPGQYEVNQEDHGNYYAGQEGKPAVTAPSYSDESRPAYITQEEKNIGVGVEAHQIQPRGNRRYCGLRLPIFVGLIVLFVIIIVAAVLGGVLGTVLSHHSSNSASAQPDSANDTSLNSSSNAAAPLQATSNTGLAARLSADPSRRLLTYYMDSENRIIENNYLTGSGWSLENHDDINASVVTTLATPGSPIAATSYTIQGVTWRQVFFIDGLGNVRETNTSTYNGTIGTNWSPPLIISTDATSSSQTVGLAACADKNGPNGIRVYYGASNYIEELAYQFNNTALGWQTTNTFPGSDPNSGVACVMYDAQDYLYMNLYLRNTSTGAVQQNFYDYLANDGWSNAGPQAWSNQTILPGSDIAACNDEENTEYVFYQVQGGMIVRGLVEPYGASYESFSTMQGGTIGTRLATEFVEGGALLIFQNSSSQSTMWASDVSRSGEPISNIAIP